MTTAGGIDKGYNSDCLEKLIIGQMYQFRMVPQAFLDYETVVFGVGKHVIIYVRCVILFSGAIDKFFISSGENIYPPPKKPLRRLNDEFRREPEVEEFFPIVASYQDRAVLGPSRSFSKKDGI